jgi:hypothetical protein
MMLLTCTLAVLGELVIVPDGVGEGRVEANPLAREHVVVHRLRGEDVRHRHG